MQDLDVSTIQAEVSYNPTPHIAIHDPMCDEYVVQLYVKYRGEWTLSHSEYEFPAYTFFSSFIATRNKWRFKVYGFVGDEFRLLLQNTYDETGKNVVFNLHSESSKIDAAYIKKAIEFQKQNLCIVFVKTRFSNLLKNSGNPFVKILGASAKIENIYATFDIRRNEIQAKTQHDWYSRKHWPERGKALETFEHQHNWMYYSQEDVFDDIIHYE
ncbi:MAG TPA: hypothetical protein EYG21_03405 [Nitrospinaceae bacterium]|nr:hypothetical protein [Nitrospinaceae bacterium]